MADLTEVSKYLTLEQIQRCLTELYCKLSKQDADLCQAVADALASLGGGGIDDKGQATLRIGGMTWYIDTDTVLSDNEEPTTGNIDATMNLLCGNTSQTLGSYDSVNPTPRFYISPTTIDAINKMSQVVTISCTLETLTKESSDYALILYYWSGGKYVPYDWGQPMGSYITAGTLSGLSTVKVNTSFKIPSTTLNSSHPPYLGIYNMFSSSTLQATNLMLNLGEVASPYKHGNWKYQGSLADCMNNDFAGTWFYVRTTAKEDGYEKYPSQYTIDGANGQISLRDYVIWTGSRLVHIPTFEAKASTVLNNGMYDKSGGVDGLMSSTDKAYLTWMVDHFHAANQNAANTGGFYSNNLTEHGLYGHITSGRPGGYGDATPNKGSNNEDIDFFNLMAIRDGKTNYTSQLMINTSDYNPFVYWKGRIGGNWRRLMSVETDMFTNSLPGGSAFTDPSTGKPYADDLTNWDSELRWYRVKKWGSPTTAPNPNWPLEGDYTILNLPGAPGATTPYARTQLVWDNSTMETYCRYIPNFNPDTRTKWNNTLRDGSNSQKATEWYKLSDGISGLNIKGVPGQLLTIGEDGQSIATPNFAATEVLGAGMLGYFNAEKEIESIIAMGENYVAMGQVGTENYPSLGFAVSEDTIEIGELTGYENSSIKIGMNITADDNTIAVGHGSETSHGGLAIGQNAFAMWNAVAVGRDAIAYEGGFAGGYQAMVQLTSDGSGGAIGSSTIARAGGAVGAHARAGNGFSGGYNAQVLDTTGEQSFIDAIQLGEGLNKFEKTLQIYDYRVTAYDKSLGHYLTDVGPLQRLATQNKDSIVEAINEVVIDGPAKTISIPDIALQNPEFVFYITRVDQNCIVNANSYAVVVHLDGSTDKCNIRLTNQQGIYRLIVYNWRDGEVTINDKKIASDFYSVIVYEVTNTTVSHKVTYSLSGVPSRRVPALLMNESITLPLQTLSAYQEKTININTPVHLTYNNKVVTWKYDNSTQYYTFYKLMPVNELMILNDDTIVHTLILKPAHTYDENLSSSIPYRGGLNLFEIWDYYHPDLQLCTNGKSVGAQHSFVPRQRYQDYTHQSSPFAGLYYLYPTLETPIQPSESVAYDNYVQIHGNQDWLGTESSSWDHTLFKIVSAYTPATHLYPDWS